MKRLSSVRCPHCRQWQGRGCFTFALRHQHEVSLSRGKGRYYRSRVLFQRWLSHVPVEGWVYLLLRNICAAWPLQVVLVGYLHIFVQTFLHTYTHTHSHTHIHTHLLGAFHRGDSCAAECNTVIITLRVIQVERVGLTGSVQLWRYDEELHTAKVPGGAGEGHA